MATRHYRLAVIGCALTWFLVGLHLPALHELTHADAAPRSGFLAIALLLALLGVAALWVLLRLPAPASGSGGSRDPLS